MRLTFFSEQKLWKLKMMYSSLISGLYCIRCIIVNVIMEKFQIKKDTLIRQHTVEIIQKICLNPTITCVLLLPIHIKFYDLIKML